MEDKEELLKRLGKNDGYDEFRWKVASDMALELDRHINFCFESLISLEKNKLIRVEEIYSK